MTKLEGATTEHNYSPVECLLRRIIVSTLARQVKQKRILQYHILFLFFFYKWRLGRVDTLTTSV